MSPIARGGKRIANQGPAFLTGFAHPDHKRGFDGSFPQRFNPTMPPWYFGSHFEPKRMLGPVLPRSYLTGPQRGRRLTVATGFERYSFAHDRAGAISFSERR
jgi:hypothetical protein